MTAETISETNPEKEITIETLPEWRRRIAELRELPGNEQETLRYIRKVRKRAVKLEAHEDVVNLDFESALVYGHITTRLKGVNDKESKRIRRNAIRGAARAVNRAEVYMSEKGLTTEWESRLCRFKGKVYEYGGHWEKARDMYELSLEKIKEDPFWKDNPAESFEREGFIAAMLIRQGKVAEGLKLAGETYDKYETDEAGKNLRKMSPEVWGKWRAGTLIGVVGALYDRGYIGVGENESIKSLDMQLLEFDDLYVEMGGSGDNFEIRREQIQKVKDLLSRGI